jgi:NhaA family Na+:H+ antiporter
LLPLGALVALAWVNAAPESYYRFTFTIAFVVNDVAMALFFGLMTKEIVEATAPNGVLHTRRLVLLPVVAAIGATVVPALLYGRLLDFLEEPMLVIGWPVTLAVDLAVTFVVARIIFGAHPVVPFLLLLGIVADGFGFVTLALLNPAGDIHLVGGALILSVAIGLAIVLRQLGVRSIWPYVFGAGTVSWLALYWGGMHPALALLPIMPFLPHAARDPGFFADALPGAKDTLSRFDVWARHPVQVTLFFFGLVNAGVPVGALEEGTWGLPLAVLAGRPIGLVIGVGLGLLAGLHLPRRVGWRELIVGAFITASGFSVGLFFCSALVPPGQLHSELSMGVLLCLVVLPLAIVFAKVSRVCSFASAVGEEC